MAQRRVGRVGQQSARALLQAHDRRAPTASHRIRNVARYTKSVTKILSLATRNADRSSHEPTLPSHARSAPRRTPRASTPRWIVEIESHVAMRAADLVRAGMAPDEARREALRRFGDFTEARRRLHAGARQREASKSHRDWLGSVRRGPRVCAAPVASRTGIHRDRHRRRSHSGLVRRRRSSRSSIGAASAAAISGERADRFVRGTRLRAVANWKHLAARLARLAPRAVACVERDLRHSPA